MSEVMKNTHRLNQLRKKVGHKLGCVLPLGAYIEDGRAYLPRFHENYQRGLLVDVVDYGSLCSDYGTTSYVGEPSSHYFVPAFAKDMVLVERSQTGEYTLRELDELQRGGMYVMLAAFGVDIYGYPRTET